MVPPSRAVPPADAAARGWPNRVETWLFDLDNTLYPASSAIFGAVTARMTAFVAARVGVALEAAAALRRRYVADHGSTLRGLMVEHGVAPDDFLADVHDVDIDHMGRDETLDRAIGRLGGRKLIFTSATVAHAERILARRGLRHHFDAIFDIAAADYVPKPAPTTYARLIARYGVVPHAAAMIDDVADNLAPAAKLGMVTVWVPETDALAHTHADRDHVHHVAPDLTRWLVELTAVRGAG
ncbi:MAG: pyrimidine 5'-nucleotidase [Alphaproteobacteria bacterium]|nr:pyrimidine 5'-nucleotidase [Alphaproteobacteria bacterium]